MSHHSARNPGVCSECDASISCNAKMCLQCFNKRRLLQSQTNAAGSTKIIWPPINELLKMIEESNYSAVGKLLGVSDNSVRKRIKKHYKHGDPRGN